MSIFGQVTYKKPGSISFELCYLFSAFYCVVVVAFSALTLLVGCQEGHPTCKKTEWWDVGMVVWDGVQTSI